MARSQNNLWLHRFAVFTAMATLGLIGLGGVVTSKGVGMAVPDWPTTYGYNMFLFPISQWTGGIFYEHTHRLFASFVGFLTIILTVWLWVKEERRWLRWLGVVALVGVVLQGVLGGLRVTLLKDEIGIVHATLAQLFLVLIIAIALFTSRWWNQLTMQSFTPVGCGLRWAMVTVTGLILLQLILGATMRHQHAGLAVPDFPLAYGELWPRMDDEFLGRVNQRRIDVNDYKPVTAFHIGLHMAHRIGAVIAFLGVAAATWSLSRWFGLNHRLSHVGFVWSGLLVLQVILGAATVLTNKAADVATLHVVVGAAALGIGSIISMVLFLYPLPANQSAAARTPVPCASLIEPREGVSST